MMNDLKKRLGRLLCKWGCHKWGKAYPVASDAWGFTCGHHRQDCTREGCTWVNNHWPS